MNLAGALLAATSKSSGSPVFLIVLIGIVGAVYFFFLRPQQQRQKQQRAERTQIEVGDEVLTVGGIVGRVVDMAGDRVTIVTGEDAEEGAAWGGAPTRVVLVRQGIARKIEPAVPAEHDVDEDELHDLDDGHDHDGHDHDGHGDAHDHDAHDHEPDHDAGDDGPTKGGRGR